MIESLAWVLPRPGKSKYIGSFPLHFEIKLLRELNLDPEKHKLLQPFGGKAKYGYRMDVKDEVVPDIKGDAHVLPFKDETFDMVLLDPPYSTDLAKRLYGTKAVHFKQYTQEAVRVCKDGGYVIIYHWYATPSVKNTLLVKRIFLETRMNHHLRCIHIHRKDVEGWKNKVGIK